MDIGSNFDQGNNDIQNEFESISNLTVSLLDCDGQWPCNVGNYREGLGYFTDINFQG